MEIEIRVPASTNRRFSVETIQLLNADQIGNDVSDDLDVPEEFKCPITCEVGLYQCLLQVAAH